MTEDKFKELRDAPYNVYVAPRRFSFDLNMDMINLIRGEFDPEAAASKFADVIKGKGKSELEKAGEEFFSDWGENWMRNTMQLGDEYPDRTIEVTMESVDREGNQFLLWPHVPQRYVEIAYLSTQKFLKLPVVLNNQYELAYRVPQCQLFGAIKEKCGDEVAGQMLCRYACLRALETLRAGMELDAMISMPAATAKDKYCEFSMKKL